MLKINVKYFLFGCYFMFCFNLLAQKKVIHQSLLWYGVNEFIELKNNYAINLELENRQFFLPNSAQHQFLVRGQLQKSFAEKKWDVAAGMCIFLHHPNYPEAINKLQVPELRPHLQTVYKQKINSLLIEQRIRAEARFFHATDNARINLEDGYEFNNLRFRYRCQFVFPIAKLHKQVMLKSKISDEIHFHFGGKTKNTFDQNRIYVGLSLDASPNTSIDVGYLNWYQFQTTNTFFNRDIVRVIFYHKLKIRK